MSNPPVELLPGDVALGQAGDQLKTLLGSCVSVILTDPRRTIGAMCHIVHVGRPNAENIRNTAYGDPAMADMFARLQQVGINPALCQAYVYGGGNMFPALFDGPHVGDKNARWVMEYLQARRIAILAHSVGGSGYRKVAWTVGPQQPMVDMVLNEQKVGNGN
jgi:chemotaxis protein CheD